MTSPRLVTRTLITSLVTVAVLLGAVFTALSLQVRDRVRRSVAENLAAGQQVFTKLEGRRQQDLLATVATLAENPTLKAALDTWLTERGTADSSETEGLLATVQREVDKIADRVSADVLAIADDKGSIVAAGGRHASAWRRARVGKPGDGDRVLSIGGESYRAVSIPMEVNNALIGSLELATSIDAEYARELSELSRGHAAIVRDGNVVASTLAARPAADLAAFFPASNSMSAQVVALGGESWAIQPLFRVGDTVFLSLASIDAAASGQTTAALKSLAWIGLGALSLAVLASIWLARTVTAPIDRLSRSLAAMATAESFRTPVPVSGTSRELDQLTTTFNSLLTSLLAAEADAEATYLGAVRALAAALDARDPYTAGHSERVSTFSVAMGQELGLDAEARETLRLGALLHDVGKIGVPDEILRKPTSLTPAEFEAIKIHPSAGARILRSIPFLASHIPIVELHHERPDGQGYPYGLVGDAIPLLARIVHVADAFDAMTSARAYRSARLPVEAIAELRRCAGSQFDPEAVEALASALPRMVGATVPIDISVFQWARARSA